MKLGLKLIAIFVAISLIPLISVVAVSIYGMQNIGTYAGDESKKSLESQLQQQMINEISSRQNTVQNFVDERQFDALALEDNPVIADYFATVDGQMNVVRQFSQDEMGVAALEIRAGINGVMQTLLETEYNNVSYSSLSAAQLKALKDDTEAIIAGTSGDFLNVKATMYSSFIPGHYGKTGYAYITDIDTDIVIHHNLVDGDSLLYNHSLTVFNQAISDIQMNKTIRTGDGFGIGDYMWADTTQAGSPLEMKFIAYTYFEPFKWIICASLYYYELNDQAIKNAQSNIEKTLLSYQKTKQLDFDSEKIPIYHDIFVTDQNGKEIASVLDGKITTDQRNNYASATWFETTIGLEGGQMYFDEVIANEDEEETMLIALPILDDTTHACNGIFGIEFHYSLISKMISDIVIGKTGYLYIINEDGILTSHPKYTIADQFDLTDPANGVELAALVSDHMLRGEAGFARYSFEGVDKFVSFAPLQLGDRQFTIAATMPTKEASAPAETLKSDIQGQTVTNLMINIAIVIIVIITVVIIGFFASRSISRPVIKIKEHAEKIAAGDLSVRVDVTSKDEVGELADTFNKMTADLNNIITDVARVSSDLAEGNLDTSFNVETKGDFSKIKSANNRMIASLTQLISQLREASEILASTSQEVASSAEEMNASTEQVSSAIQQISKGSQEQATQVEDTVNVTRDMTNSAEDVKNRADSATLAAKKAAEKSQVGRNAVKSTVTKMEEIQKVVNQSAITIQNLGKRSEEIDEIVNMITNITEQTNLLALNAAIEAARVGEQGRGFAVVAEEVKNLAEDSREAAERISKMIKEIQSETTKAVDSMQQGTKEVEEGILAVNQTDRAFMEISNAADITSGEVDSISVSMGKMKNNTERIAKAVDGIASIAEETASASEESASSTEELTASMEDMTARAQDLSEMALSLQKSANRFKIDDGKTTKTKKKEMNKPHKRSEPKKRPMKRANEMPKKVEAALKKRGLAPPRPEEE